MKKLFILIIAAFGFISSQAQSGIILQGTNDKVKGLDTVVNAGTVYLTTPAGALDNAGLYGNYALQVTATSISGSLSVTYVVQSSLDGVNWENHFQTPGQDGRYCDTLAIVAATSHIWQLSAKSSRTIQTGGVVINQWATNAGRRLYFRVKCVGAGTQSTQVKARLITQN